MCYYICEVMNMSAKIIILCVAVILCVAAIFTMVSCKTQRYKVHCDELFENVKSSYKPGDRVNINYPYIATDTDYKFYLDGEAVNASYDEGRGYVLEFTMPDRDVKVTVESRNSMVYTPIPTEAGTLLIDYWEKTLSTAEGEQEIYQITVEATEMENEHLAVLQMGDNRQEYIIPISVYESLVNFAENSCLEEWNYLEDPFSLEGKIISFTLCVDGEYLEISSDSMPEDGETVLEYLRLSIKDHLIEANEK